MKVKVHHKTPNNFYKLQPPVKVWYNRKEKCWRLLDNRNTIIADKLTKELVETLKQAVNYCGIALDFTKSFVECEYIVENREDIPDDAITYRNAMYDQALAFMVKLGVIDPPPKYIDAFPIWRDQLMDDFYKKVRKYE